MNYKEEVKKALIENKCEHPFSGLECNQSKGHSQELELGVLRMYQYYGLNTDNDSIKDTPKRVSKMYEELFSGLNYDNFPPISLFENSSDGMVIQSKIEVKSVCEHHLMPIVGNCHIGYIPSNGKVVGLSKLNRITEFFCRRPQIQERLVKQILVALQVILQTEDIVVSLKSEHFCVKFRGIQHDSEMVTTETGGLFKSSQSLRNEFFQSLKL